MTDPKSSWPPAPGAPQDGRSASSVPPPAPRRSAAPGRGSGPPPHDSSRGAIAVVPDPEPSRGAGGDDEITLPRNSEPHEPIEVDVDLELDSAPHAAAEAPLAPAPVAVDLDSDVEEYHSSPNVAGHLAQAQPEPSSPPAQQAQLQPLSPIRPRRAVLLDQDSVPPPMPSSPSSPGSGSPANPSETRASAPPPPGVPAYSSAPPPHLQSSGPRERQNPGSYRYAAGPRGDQDVVTSASLPAGGSPERSSSIPPGDSTPPRARLDALIDSYSSVPPPRHLGSSPLPPQLPPVEPRVPDASAEPVAVEDLVDDLLETDEPPQVEAVRRSPDEVVEHVSATLAATTTEPSSARFASAPDEDATPVPPEPHGVEPAPPIAYSPPPPPRMPSVEPVMSPSTRPEAAPGGTPEHRAPASGQEETERDASDFDDAPTPGPGVAAGEKRRPSVPPPAALVAAVKADDEDVFSAPDLSLGQEVVEEGLAADDGDEEVRLSEADLEIASAEAETGHASGSVVASTSGPTSAPRPPEQLVVSSLGATDPSESRKPPPPRRSAKPALPAAKIRRRPWWETLFGDDFARAHRCPTPAQLGREVDFIVESLGLARGQIVLDLACGQGEHAVEMSRRGISVVGYDLSVFQLAMAGDRAQAENQKINFLQGDMREMAFDAMFDAVLCWDTSFGYFEEEKNLDVARRIFLSLKPGGSLLLMVMNRDFAAKESPTNIWFEGDGCVCMDDVDFDWITSRLRVKRSLILDDGRSKELHYSLRLYNLSEIGKLLHEVGFRVAAVSGNVSTPGAFFGPASPFIIIRAQRP